VRRKGPTRCRTQVEPGDKRRRRRNCGTESLSVGQSTRCLISWRTRSTRSRSILPTIKVPVA
jgi:hypothetical protein